MLFVIVMRFELKTAIIVIIIIIIIIMLNNNNKPQSVSETGKTKVLWDFNIQCDHIIEAKRPDIMVVGKVDRVYNNRCCRTS